MPVFEQHSMIGASKITRRKAPSLPGSSVPESPAPPPVIVLPGLDEIAIQYGWRLECTMSERWRGAHDQLGLCTEWQDFLLLAIADTMALCDATVSLPQELSEAGWVLHRHASSRWCVWATPQGTVETPRRPYAMNAIADAAFYHRQVMMREQNLGIS